MAARYYCATCLHTFTTGVEVCPNLACRAERPERGWGVVLGAGDVLDRHYEVERVLAVGGAGITYLAHRIDAEGGRHPPPVAVKVLFHSRDAGGYLRRLSVEAQVLRDLDHDHIVQCLGFTQRLGESPYLVTRFESGGDLLSNARDGRSLSPPMALAVLQQVLRALHVAHDNGIVHRDLKPENVLIEGDTPAMSSSNSGLAPRVRVTDFGVAKVMSARAGFTRVGAFIGTPEYAAPEQFVGEPATPATDVFAAGGLLHFLLTHRSPVRFSDRTDFPRCYRELVEACPPQLEEQPPGDLLRHCQALIDGMMQPARRQRWRTDQALERLQELDLPALPPRRPDDLWAIPSDRRTVPLPEDAPEFTGTILPEPAPEPKDVRPLASEDHESASPAARDLTLDDLFTFQEEESEAQPSRRDKPRHATPDPAALTGGGTPRSVRRLRTPAPAPEPSRPLPRQRRRGRPPPRSVEAFGGAPAHPTAVGPDPGRPDRRPDPQALPSQADGTLWAPETPAPLPAELPDTPTGLLSLLGQVSATDREVVLEALARMDSRGVTRALRAGARSRERAVRCGSALAIGGLQRSSLASVGRALSSDKDPVVRALGCHALGLIGRAGALTTLSRRLTDEDALVRASAAMAVARAARAASRASIGRGWLDRLHEDSDPMVAAAVATAIDWLS